MEFGSSALFKGHGTIGLYVEPGAGVGSGVGAGVGAGVGLCYRASYRLESW